MGNVRTAVPMRLGGPKAPVNPDPVRVSTTRQGVIPTNTSEFAGVCASGVIVEDAVYTPELPASICLAAASLLSTALGCQYIGASQPFRGTLSRSRRLWADRTETLSSPIIITAVKRAISFMCGNSLIDRGRQYRETVPAQLYPFAHLSCSGRFSRKRIHSVLVRPSSSRERTSANALEWQRVRVPRQPACQRFPVAGLCFF